MKTLIFLLGIIVGCFSFALGDLTPEQAKIAQKLVQSSRLEVIQTSCFDSKKFHMLCEGNGLGNLLEESFYYKNKKTTLKEESSILSKLNDPHDPEFIPTVVQIHSEENIDLNCMVSKDSIKELLEKGTPIQNIPSNFLDKGDDIIWQYIKACSNEEVPEDKSTSENQEMILEISKKFFEAHYSELPKEHREKIMTCCLKYLTKKQKGDLRQCCGRLAKTSVDTKQKIVYPSVSSFDLEMPSFELDSEMGTPSVTQKRKAKRAAASARDAQRGPSKTLPQESEAGATGEIPFDNKLFDLTPGSSSKVLNKVQIDAAINIIKSLIDELKEFEIDFEVADSKNHYLISADRIEPEWANEFYTSHTKPSKLTMKHGANKPHTDHYNAAISYLLHYVCLLALNKPSARAACRSLLEEYRENLVEAEIERAYPGVLSLIFD